MEWKGCRLFGHSGTTGRLKVWLSTTPWQRTRERRCKIRAVLSSTTNQDELWALCRDHFTHRKGLTSSNRAGECIVPKVATWHLSTSCPQATPTLSKTVPDSALYFDSPSTCNAEGVSSDSALYFDSPSTCNTEGVSSRWSITMTTSSE
jgi:hypothetical protein